jgi:hypothetical protein
MADLADLRAADVAEGSPRCRGCGCTDRYGCAPRCWWVEPDLCSRCARRAQLVHLEHGARLDDLVDVVNALAGAVEIIADQVQMILDVLELDDGYPPEIIDVPGPDTYEPDHD